MPLSSPQWSRRDIVRCLKQLVGQPRTVRLYEAGPVFRGYPFGVPLAWRLLTHIEKLADVVATDPLDNLPGCGDVVLHGESKARELNSHSQDYFYQDLWKRSVDNPPRTVESELRT
jgi:hypothetical protein